MMNKKRASLLEGSFLFFIPIGFGDMGRRQMSEAPLSPWMECILSNVRNVASSSLRVVGDWGE
ncbi:hypothetical protein ACH42_15915 [Endozoicomonas sp. (ex Bugula neritina AB1)]|nr:hypothetical protein ACH42_15915 [Endozoicomonas sp. (ex Bugula neritina AB1)]